MAEKYESGVKTGLWVVGVLVALTLIVSLVAVARPVGVSESAVKSIITTALAGIKIPTPTVDLTGVEERIADVQSTLDEEDNWKDEAKALATAEWEEREYKAIYKAIDNLYGDIDEREDIEYVTVKTEEVTSFDVDDKDATVVQDLKVRYEDLNGDTKKVYLTVTTVIDEGEVEDQEIVET